MFFGTGRSQSTSISIQDGRRIDMRKWYVPLAVLSLGGLGVVLATDGGRRAMRRLGDVLEDAPEHLDNWSEAIEGEVATIQEAINSIASALGTPRQQPAQ
jgi:hypothetical protein